MVRAVSVVCMQRSHRSEIEKGHWDTSKAQVRRTLEKCIHFGRLHRAHGRKQDEYEAFRLLGTAVRKVTCGAMLAFQSLCSCIPSKTFRLTPTSASSPSCRWVTHRCLLMLVIMSNFKRQTGSGCTRLSLVRSSLPCYRLSLTVTTLP